MVYNSALHVQKVGIEKVRIRNHKPTENFYSGERRWVTARAIFQLSGNILKTGDRPDRKCF